jgi:spore coat protein H
VASLKFGPYRWPLGAILTLVLGVLLLGCSSSSSQDGAPESSGVARLLVSLDPADLDDLYARDPFSEDPIDAMATIDDGPALPIEIRFRGSSSRLLPKKSFNIRFQDGQDLLFGSDRMNANAMYTDPAMMREHLAWGMFAALGRPASRTQYLDIWLNGIYEGLYIHVERVDQDLLRAAGLNPEGTLVRDEFRDRRLEDPRIDVASAFAFPLSEIPEAEREQFLADGFDSRGSPRWDRLAELILWVEASMPGADFAQGFRERFDPEVFIDWLAVHFLIGDIDSFADDYWLYLDHDDEQARWIVIPWNKDLSFGSHWRPDFGTANDFFAYDMPVGTGWNNPLVNLVLETPELRDDLAERMAYLMREVFTRAYFAERMETQWHVIAASVERQPGAGAFDRHPQNHHSTQGVPELHMETILDFVELRYTYLDLWPEPKPRERPWGGSLTPPDPPPLSADADTRSVWGARAGDSVFFTDVNGWTIARIDFLWVPQGLGGVSRLEGDVEISVREDPTQTGIDRVWTLRMDGFSGFDGLLTLYYRNEHPEMFSGENWYTDGMEPVGRQWDLVMAERFGSSTEILPGARVNPFSNKVEALVTVAPGLAREFVVTVP